VRWRWGSVEAETADVEIAGIEQSALPGLSFFLRTLAGGFGGLGVHGSGERVFFVFRDGLGKFKTEVGSWD